METSPRSLIRHACVRSERSSGARGGVETVGIMRRGVSGRAAVSGAAGVPGQRRAQRAALIP